MPHESTSEVALSSSVARSRRYAHFALLVAAVGFVLSRNQPEPVFGYLRAFCEAALVGGLADWFAVTALFRRPLGLPIPHTAIIPRNKERLGFSLGSFVQTNFLSEEVIESKLAGKDLALKAVEWASVQSNRQRVVGELIRHLPDAISTINDDDISRLLVGSLKDVLRSIDGPQTLARLITLLVEGDKHNELLDELIRIASEAVTQHEESLRSMLRQEMPWYIPGFVHDKVYRTVVSRARGRLTELHATRDHPGRAAFGEWLRRFSEEMRKPGELRDRILAVQQWLLETAVVGSYVGKVWRDIKSAIQRDAHSPESLLAKWLEQTIEVVAKNLERDQAAREKVNAVLRRSIRAVVRSYGSTVVRLIAGTVRQWDSATLVSKLELEVGKDLQYIRLNGTLVGGFVGLLLHIVSTW